MQIPSQPKSSINYYAYEPTLSLVENEEGYFLNFELYCALPILELLAHKFSGIAISIGKSASQEAYQYFTGGDFSKIEEDIDSYFNRLSEASSLREYREKYDAYAYEEISLFSFLSDEILTEMGRIQSSFVVTDGGKKYKLNPSPADYKRLWRNISYLARSSKEEEPFALSYYPNLPFGDKSLYFRNLASLSVPIPAVADVQFPRSFTNENFSGISGTSTDDLIKINDSQWPEEFWNLWACLFSFSASSRENLPEFVNVTTPLFPVHIKATVPFLISDTTPAGDLALIGATDTAQQRLIAFLTRGNVDLNLGFIGGDSLEPITFPLDMIRLLKKSACTLEKVEVSITNNFLTGEDEISIYNPNHVTLNVRLDLMGWNPVSYKLEKVATAASFSIGPRHTTVTSVAVADIQCRYYSGFQTVAYADLLNHVTSFNFNPVTPLCFGVSGVMGIDQSSNFNPLLTIRDSGDSYVASVATPSPSWDRFHWYYRPLSKRNHASTRAPGTNRQGWTFLGFSPDQESFAKGSLPSRSWEISKSSLTAGEYYEILVDFYKNDCLKDTASMSLYYCPYTSYAGMVDFNVVCNSQDHSDTLTISESINSSASSLITELISKTVLPESYEDEFDEAKASNKVVTAYKVTRHNVENGSVEELGSFDSGEVTVAHSNLTTPSRFYEVKLFANSIGQLMTSNQPSAASEVPGGTGLSYTYNYAKFKSNDMAKNSSLPSFSYNLDIDVPAIINRSYTGASQTCQGLSSTASRPGFVFTGVNFETVLKANIISWKKLAHHSGENPNHFVMRAKYGGVTSVVAWCPYISGVEEYTIADFTMYGALGLVIYKLFAVYGDGSYQYHAPDIGTMHENDQMNQIILGRGLI